MKTILSAIVLAALTLPAHAGNLGIGLGAAADSRRTATERQLDRLQRDNELRAQQMQQFRLQQQIEENNRMLREIEQQQFRQKHGIKPY